MAYWACARLEPHRERLALHCLEASGFTTYFPRIRDQCVRNGRKIERRPPLFPGYAFVLIHLQWHAARWSVGVLNLIMNGDAPAHVADSIIAEIRGRERGGLFELPRREKFRTGEVVRVTHGPFADHVGLFAGMRPRQRVEILLQLLGGEQRVTLAKKDIEVVR